MDQSQAYRQFVTPAFLDELLLDVEDLPDGPGDNAALGVVLLDAGPTLHGVGLAAASLTVGEHTDVVAVQRGLGRNYFKTIQVENISLTCTSCDISW